MPRYAAIDIGSNSIRLQVAEAEDRRPVRILFEDRQVTRLGESVFRTGAISREASESLAAVLQKMAAAYRAHNVLAARIVATAAVRDASNGAEFLERMSELTGQRVEVISGQEEARLIHLGVASRWPQGARDALIVDIGGGSAEIIATRGDTLDQAFSRPLGAIRITEVFLKSDPPTEDELRRMEEYIEEKLLVPLRRLGGRAFPRAIGTSGSASAVACAVNRIPRARREEADRRRATAAQIRRLYRHLRELNLPARRKVTGVGPRRAEIIVPGAAVLLRVLESFRVPTLYYCTGGVRDGLIRDLADRGVGRELSRLSREQRMVVEGMARRFGVDLRHARKVAGFAHTLFEGLHPLHELPRENGRLLEAAAWLRDVGHLISDTSHHKHSAYIIANADLAGFTAAERQEIALLCRFHRKAMPGARHQDYQELSPERRRVLLLLTPLLRLADALDRSREQRIEAAEVRVETRGVGLGLVSRRDIGLEQWAVERAGETFAAVYERPLRVVRGSLP